MTTEGIESAVDIVSEGVGEISEATPYVKQAVAAYKWVRKKRISTFIRSLDISSKEFSDKEQEKFAKYIADDYGQELLAEYSDTVLNTTSNIANSALGILYSDFGNAIYPEDIKQLVCYGLKGSTDHLLTVFILLCNIEPKDTKGPYPVCLLTKEEYEGYTALTATLSVPEDSFACVNDLIRRGLLLPDHSTNRYGGKAWYCNFGITQKTLAIRDLLVKAKKLID